jgi:hypothetical protein
MDNQLYKKEEEGSGQTIYEERKGGGRDAVHHPSDKGVTKAPNVSRAI